MNINFNLGFNIAYYPYQGCISIGLSWYGMHADKLTEEELIKTLVRDITHETMHAVLHEEQGVATSALFDVLETFSEISGYGIMDRDYYIRTLIKANLKVKNPVATITEYRNLIPQKQWDKIIKYVENKPLPQDLVAAGRISTFARLIPS